MDKKFPTPAAFSQKKYEAISMALVESNQVACIGYDVSTQTLAVQFRHGAGHIYHYPNVSPETHEAFMNAESKGSFFKKHIRPLAFDKFPVPEGRSDRLPEEA